MPFIRILCLLVKISEKGKVNELQPCFAKLPASKNGREGRGGETSFLGGKLSFT